MRYRSDNSKEFLEGVQSLVRQRQALETFATAMLTDLRKKVEADEKVSLDQVSAWERALRQAKEEPEPGSKASV